MAKIQSITKNAPIHLFLIVSSLMLVIVPYLNKTPGYRISEQTVHAASQFLFLVDQEEYAKSWEVSSGALKKMLPQNEWNKKIAQIRAALGPIIERFQHEISYTDSADDHSSGQYVVVTFISKFKLRERVTESITLLLGENDQWRVVGYFLQ